MSLRLPDPDETLRKFAVGLAKQVAPDGWMVAREMDGRSNRGFILERGTGQIHFFAKLSQTERGFWGLTEARARELEAGPLDHLVLLTGAYGGYFIEAGRLKRLLPTFARGEKDRSYKINEGKLAHEKRFTTLVRFWDYLKAASANA